MAFGGHGGGHKKKHDGGPVMGLIRFILSIFIMCILGLGLLLAYRNFSGVNPLTMSPSQIFRSFLSADSAYNLITGLLTFDPQDSLSKAKETLTSDPEDPNNPSFPEERKPTAPLSFKFAVIADSHKDTTGLKKALTRMKNEGAKFVVGMGDNSDVGTIEELRDVKTQFDASGLPYYVVAGDRDMWESRDKKKDPVQNFKDVFGNSYQSFAYSNVRFILISDSDNYNGLDDLQLKWIDDELERWNNEEAQKLLFVAAATPLYHPSSDHVMGKVTPSLKNQAEHLISIFKKGGVDEVFSADTHYFTRYVEPTMDLKMTTVGALTNDRNPQTPRFAMVNVFEDGTYEVKETVVD